MVRLENSFRTNWSPTVTPSDTEQCSTNTGTEEISKTHINNNTGVGWCCCCWYGNQPKPKP